MDEDMISKCLPTQLGGAGRTGVSALTWAIMLLTSAWVWAFAATSAVFSDWSKALSARSALYSALLAGSSPVAWTVSF